jgi:hypothetical protein
MQCRVPGALHSLPSHLESDHVRPLCLLGQWLKEVPPHMGQTAREFRLTAITHQAECRALQVCMGLKLALQAACDSEWDTT